jgi:hypothetical protein
MGPISTFLGNDIKIENKYLYINQNKYIEKLLIKFNIINNKNYKPIKIPRQPGLKLFKNSEQASKNDINEY